MRPVTSRRYLVLVENAGIALSEMCSSAKRGGVYMLSLLVFAFLSVSAEHIPGTEVKQPGGYSHKSVADIHIIVPPADANTGYKKEGGHSSYCDRCNEIITGAGFLPFVPVVKAEAKYKHHQPIGGVDFHKPEIESGEGQGSKYHQLHNIKP